MVGGGKEVRCDWGVSVVEFKGTGVYKSNKPKEKSDNPHYLHHQKENKKILQLLLHNLFYQKIWDFGWKFCHFKVTSKIPSIN